MVLVTLADQLRKMLDGDFEDVWEDTTPKTRLFEAEFLVETAGYLIAHFRHHSSGHLDSSDRGSIETWFQTVSLRIDRFHSF